MSDQCTVSGGSASTEARYTDMRTAAGRLDGSGNEAGDLCKAAFGIGTSLPAKSAILSPGSALSIAGQITDLTLGLGGLTLRMEFVARTLRWSATAYELTDDAQRQLLAAINTATAPVRESLYFMDAAAEGVAAVPAAVVTRHFGDAPGAYLHTLDRDVRNDPGLADGLLSWIGAGVWAAGSSAAGFGDAFGLAPDGLQRAAAQLSPAAALGHFAASHHLGAPPPPQDFEGQVGWLLATGRMLGFFNDTKPLSVTRASERKRPATRRRLADIVGAATDVEHRSGKTKSVLLVRRVVGKDGKGAWVVAIPGTTHWSAYTDHGPSDATANVATMAGVKSSLYPAIDKALAAAMKESGVRPGTEPVMVAGHSQGGIVAARLAVDDEFRTKYHLREVVAYGSPIDRMHVPSDVNVLSIENNHDVVPHADGVAPRDAINRVDVTCEAPKGEQLHSVRDAHDASRYVRTAEGLTADSDPQLAQWYARNDKFLDGQETDYEFDLRRP